MKVDIYLRVERKAYNKFFKIVGKVHQIDTSNEELIKQGLFKAYKILENQIDISINNYRKNGGSHNDRN